jgi:hypothetical protein
VHSVVDPDRVGEGGRGYKRGLGGVAASEGGGRGCQREGVWLQARVEGSVYKQGGVASNEVGGKGACLQEGVGGVSKSEGGRGAWL